MTHRKLLSMIGYGALSKIYPVSAFVSFDLSGVFTMSSTMPENIWVILSLCLTSFGMSIFFFKNSNDDQEKREEELELKIRSLKKELRKEKEKNKVKTQQLRELDTLKSQFFADISHELRTPLTLILEPLEKLFNSKLNMDCESIAEQKEMILRNSDRLLSLIDQLLDVSRIESSKIPIRPEPVLILPFLHRNIALYSEGLKAKSIQLTLHSTALSNEVYIDPQNMDKVIGNLINNAMKFTPDKGKITILLDENDNEFMITVKDTGIGIDADELPNIFDRFYQVRDKDIKSIEGFGIGLSIAKEIIELHHGSINVTSSPGEGTTFSIHLLKGNDHFQDLEVEASPSKTSAPTPVPLSKPVRQGITITSEENELTLPVNYTHDQTTILIIEDNPDMRNYIKSLLVKQYQILEATNGIDAYTGILESPPDLIIADIMMPKMDGLELNRKLKSNPDTSSIPLIFISGKTAKHSQIYGIEEGADFYLTKPFDSKELIVSVQNLLTSRHRLRDKIIRDLNGYINLKKIKSDDPDPFIKLLNDVLEKDYSNPELSVHLIQEKMFMSRSSLYRMMNEKTGLNTQQYVNQFRLEKAKEMLLNEKASISEIAYACGFNSLSYFSRTFKDRFGKSPSEFLKSHPGNG